MHLFWQYLFKGLNHYSHFIEDSKVWERESLGEGDFEITCLKRSMTEEINSVSG